MPREGERRAAPCDWIDLPETMRGVILTDTLTLPKVQADRSGLGAAVDLGTTTVALRLFDRADGKLLAQAQDWNAQAPYGADVISRIQHTMEALYPRADRDAFRTDTFRRRTEVG